MKAHMELIKRAKLIWHNCLLVMKMRTKLWEPFLAVEPPEMMRNYHNKSLQCSLHLTVYVYHGQNGSMPSNPKAYDVSLITTWKPRCTQSLIRFKRSDKIGSP